MASDIRQPLALKTGGHKGLSNKLQNPHLNMAFGRGQRSASGLIKEVGVALARKRADGQ